MAPYICTKPVQARSFAIERKYRFSSNDYAASLRSACMQMQAAPSTILFWSDEFDEPRSLDVSNVPVTSFD